MAKEKIVLEFTQRELDIITAGLYHSKYGRFFSADVEEAEDIDDLLEKIEIVETSNQDEE